LLFLSGAARGFLGAEAREIVPVLVVFGGVGLAEIPALAAVRRLGRGPVADLVAALAVAQAHLRRRAALVAVAAPAGKAPVVGSFLFRHSIPLAVIARSRATKQSSSRRWIASLRSQ